MNPDQKPKNRSAWPTLLVNPTPLPNKVGVNNEYVFSSWTLQPVGRVGCLFHKVIQSVWFNLTAINTAPLTAVATIDMLAPEQRQRWIYIRVHCAKWNQVLYYGGKWPGPFGKAERNTGVTEITRRKARERFTPDKHKSYRSYRSHAVVFERLSIDKPTPINHTHYIWHRDIRPIMQANVMSSLTRRDARSKIQNIWIPTHRPCTSGQLTTISREKTNDHSPLIT